MNEIRRTRQDDAMQLENRITDALGNVGLSRKRDSIG